MKNRFPKKWYEMLKVLSLISDDELKAMEHQIPMTQELFNSILQKITGQGITELYEDFLIEFQQFLSIDEEKV